MVVLCTETDEDLLLKQALEMSMQPTASDDEQMTSSAPTSLATRDFSMMSEDEQVAYAMQMSMDPTGLFCSTCCSSNIVVVVASAASALSCIIRSIHYPPIDHESTAAVYEKANSPKTTLS